MAQRYAFGNHKGGVGKTAVVVQLAATLAAKDKRVLVVDLDPQATASRRLGVPRFDPDQPTVTISEVIKSGGEGVARQAIVPAGWDDSTAARIDVLPSRFDLENRVSEAGTVGALVRLRKALHGVDADYDYTFFDLPPSLGHLTQLGLVAADAVIVVTEPEYDSIEGAIRLRDFVHTHGADLGAPNLGIAGVIVSKRTRINAHTYQLEQLPQIFPPEAIWTPYIPDYSKMADANEAALPVTALRGSRAVADLRTAFGDLADRLITMQDVAA